MADSSIVLRFDIDRLEPRIWRIVRVPGDLPLTSLHTILQIVMAWTGTHAHAFEVHNNAASRHGAGRGAVWTAVDERLSVAEALAASHDAFGYRYGDAAPWRVLITRARGHWQVRRKAPILCIDGYLAAPVDDGHDCTEYNAVLAATLGRGPGLTDAQRQRLGPRFDPENFDRGAINRQLARLTLMPSEAS